MERKQADHGRLNALLGLARRRLAAGRRCSPISTRRPRPAATATSATALPNALTRPRPRAWRSPPRCGRANLSARAHLIDILTGSATQKVRDRGHESLPTFGVGKAFSQRDWQAIFRQMMGLDLLRPDPERHGALRVTDRARPVLRGEEPVTLRRDTMKAAKVGPKVKALVADEDAPLLSALKAKRRALAEAAQVPAYIIFTDRTLAEMAERRPPRWMRWRRSTAWAPRNSTAMAARFSRSSLARHRPLSTRAATVGVSGQGALYDRLLAAQAALARGADGTTKPMSLTAAQLARIADQRPRRGCPGPPDRRPRRRQVWRGFSRHSRRRVTARKKGVDSRGR